ncbi:MAG: pyruvate kinase [Candidatus Omnitrophota bacterium]
MKRTKIVATVGPACKPKPGNAKHSPLEALIRAGVDIFRINASHTTPDQLRQWILAIRKASRSAGSQTGILVDLQGPRIRTGKLSGSKPVLLKAGDEIVLEAGMREGTFEVLTTPCRQLPKMLKAGDRILLDNGLMALEVLRISMNRISCRVKTGGLLGENKGMNLPDAPVTLPTLGDKDHASLKIAAQQEVDFIALSFVRSAKDVLTVKRALKKYGSAIPIVAKIEKPAAVERLAEILKVTDALMVARGDLGIEMGVEKVPMVQKQLIREANRRQIPVITATQMLESMMTQVYPTRAEASDIANAVLDGTDAVMLSGETANGQYPLLAVQTMSRIIEECERAAAAPAYDGDHERLSRRDLVLHAITDAARDAADDLAAKALVVFTRSGKTAVFTSKLRPRSPIIALTPFPATARRLQLLHGVVPVLMPSVRHTDAMIRAGCRVLLSTHRLRRNDCVVLVSGKNDTGGSDHMVKIHRI